MSTSLFGCKGYFSTYSAAAPCTLAASVPCALAVSVVCVCSPVVVVVAAAIVVAVTFNVDRDNVVPSHFF